MQNRPNPIEDQSNQSDSGFLSPTLEGIIAQYLTFSESEALKRAYLESDSKMGDDKKEEAKAVAKTSHLPFFKTDQDSIPNLRPFIQSQLNDPEVFAEAGIQLVKKLLTEEEFKELNYKRSFAEVEASVTGMQFVYMQMRRLEGLFNLEYDTEIPHDKITKPIAGPTLADISVELTKMQQQLKEKKNPDFYSYAQQIQKMALARIEEISKVYPPEEFKKLFIHKTENRVKELFNPSSKVQFFDQLWRRVHDRIGSQLMSLGNEEYFKKFSDLTDDELFFLVNLECKNMDLKEVAKRIIDLEYQLTRRDEFWPEKRPLRMRTLLAYCRNHFHPPQAHWFKEDFSFIATNPEMLKVTMEIKGFFATFQHQSLEIFIPFLIATGNLITFKKMLADIPGLANSSHHIDIVSSWHAYAFLSEMVLRDGALESFVFKVKGDRPYYQLYEFIFDSFFKPQTENPATLAEIEKLFFLALEKILAFPNTYLKKEILEKLSIHILNPNNQKLVLETAKKNKLFLQLKLPNSDVYYDSKFSLPLLLIKKGNAALGLELMKLGGSVEGLQLSDGGYALFRSSSNDSTSKLEEKEKSPATVPSVFAEFIQYLKQNEESLLKSNPNLFKIIEAISSQRSSLQPSYQVFLTYVLDFYPDLLTKHTRLPLHSAFHESTNSGTFLLQEMQKRKLTIDAEDMNQVFETLFSQAFITQQMQQVLEEFIETSKELPTVNLRDLRNKSSSELHFNLVNRILSRRKDGFEWIKASTHGDPSALITSAARKGHMDLVLSLLFRGVECRDNTLSVEVNCQPLVRALQDLNLNRKDFTAVIPDEKDANKQAQLMSYLAQNVAPEEKDIIDQLNGLANVHKGLSSEIIESVIRANIQKLLKPFLAEKKKPGFFESLLSKPKPVASLFQKLMMVQQLLAPKPQKVLKAGGGDVRYRRYR